MYNFPDNPTIGQEVSTPNGQNYKWNGTTWDVPATSGLQYPMPISQGGTGEVTAPAAIAALGGLPVVGGRIAGTPGSLVIGTPSGGDKGPGSLNVASLYIEGNLVTPPTGGALPVNQGGTGQTSLSPGSGYGVWGSMLVGQGTDPILPVVFANGQIGAKSASALACLGYNNNWGYIDLGTMRGNPASLQATRGGEVLGAVFFSGGTASGWNATWNAMVVAAATEDWTDTAQGARLRLVANRMGTTSPFDIATLAPERFYFRTDQLRLDAAGENSIIPANPTFYMTSLNGAALAIDAWGDDRLILRRTNGTPSASGPILTGDQFTTIEWQGRVPGGYDTTANASIRVFALEDWQSGARGTKMVLRTTNLAGGSESAVIDLSHEKTEVFSNQLVVHGISDPLPLDLHTVGNNDCSVAYNLDGSYKWSAGLKGGASQGQFWFYNNTVDRLNLRLMPGGDIYAYGTFYAANFFTGTGAPGIGYLRIDNGDNSLAGQLSFFKPDGSRIGYFGGDPTVLNVQLDGGAKFYIRASSGDALQLVGPQAAGQHARLVTTVPNVRAWSMGTLDGGPFQIGDETAFVARFQINLTGATINTTGSWSTFSDRSLKENIEPYTRGLAAVMELKPVSFNYKAGTPMTSEEEPSSRLFGLLANDVKSVIPEIVDEGTGKVRGEEVPLDMLRPGDLIYVLINAIKELKGELEELKAPSEQRSPQPPTLNVRRRK